MRKSGRNDGVPRTRLVVRISLLLRCLGMINMRGAEADEPKNVSSVVLKTFGGNEVMRTKRIFAVIYTPRLHLHFRLWKMFNPYPESILH